MNRNTFAVVVVLTALLASLVAAVVASRRQSPAPIVQPHFLMAKTESQAIPLPLLPIPHPPLILGPGDCVLTVISESGMAVKAATVREAFDQSVLGISDGNGKVIVPRMTTPGFLSDWDQPVLITHPEYVVDQAGKPMAGFEVEWIDEGGLFETFTDKEGRFRFAKVKGGEGRLTLTNELLGDETLFEGSAGGGMELLARVKRGTLRGRVLDKAGKPGPGIVSVTMKSLDDSWTQLGVRLDTLYPAVGQDGRFEIRLPLGSWTLEADDGERMSQREVIEVGLGATDALLRLSEAIK